MEWSPFLKTNLLHLEATAIPQVPFSLEQLLSRIPSLVGWGGAMNFTCLTSPEVCEHCLIHLCCSNLSVCVGQCKCRVGRPLVITTGLDHQ